MSQDNININVTENIDEVNIVASEIVEVVDLNLYATTEDVTINVTEDIIQVNVNKVTATEQIQSDWNQTNTDALDFIKNKPTIPEAITNTSELVNDGADGVNPFITLQDIPAPITIDAVPTDGSSNAVSSNGVFDALANKQNSLGFTPENVANKATNLTSPDNTKYPTTQAVVDGLATKQNVITNPVTGTGANGQVVFWNATNSQTGDNGLFWDNTNKRLAVGTTTAGARLDVRAQGALSTDIAFRVRNSGDTSNIIEVNGLGQVGIGTSVDTGTLPSRIKITPLNSKIANIGNFNSATLPATINDGDLYVYGGNLWLNSNFANPGLKGVLYQKMKLTGLQPDFYYGSGVAKNFNQFSSGNYNTFGWGSLVHSGYSYGNTIMVNNPTSVGVDSRMYDGFLMSLCGTETYSPNPQLFVDIKGNIFARGNGIYAESDWKKALTDNANKTTTVGGETNYPSAKFAIDSTTRGFLPPRMTNAQRLAIASPAVGLMVYCTDATEGLYINKSTGWTFII